MDGIDLVRAIFKYLWIDKVRCERLLDCLRDYHKEYDEKNKLFKPTPKHDWTSHASDAMRYLAIVFQLLVKDINNHSPNSHTLDMSNQI